MKQGRPTGTKKNRVQLNTKIDADNWQWLHDMKGRGYKITRLIDKGIALVRNDENRGKDGWR